MKRNCYKIVLKRTFMQFWCQQFWPKYLYIQTSYLNLNVLI